VLVLQGMQNFDQRFRTAAMAGDASLDAGCHRAVHSRLQVQGGRDLSPPVHLLYRDSTGLLASCSGSAHQLPPPSIWSSPS